MLELINQLTDIEMKTQTKFGLFAGLITLIYPLGVFKDRLFVSIHTMVHHSLMLWTGVYV